MGGKDWSTGDVNIGLQFAVRARLLGAVARDMARLAALVTGLASGVKRSAVGRGAVAGNVAELATGVALHGLGLAVTSKVVGATALVAGGRTRPSAGEAASHRGKATTGDRSTAAKTRDRRVGAVALSVTQD